MKKLLTIMCAAMGVAAFGEVIEGARVGEITGENWGYMNQYGGYNVYVFTNTAEEISVEITEGGSAELFIVGGGGSGGNVAGGGGQGGAVVSKTLDTLGEGTYTVKVGKGGLQGPLAGHDYYRTWSGSAGSASSFGDYCAAGGNGGGSYNAGRTGEGAGNAHAGGNGAGGAADGYTGGVGIESSIVDGETVIAYGAGGGGGHEGPYDLEGPSAAGSAWAGMGGRGNPDGQMNEGTQGGHGVDGTGSGGGGGGWWCNEGTNGGGNGGSGIVVLKVNTLNLSDNVTDVINVGVNGIGATFATIGYQVVNFGDGERATVELEFGTESGEYTKSVLLNDAAGDEVLAKEVRLFSAATKYYARLKAKGDGANAEAGYSAEFTFTTHAAPPVVASVTGNYTVNEYGVYRAYVFEDTAVASSIAFSRGGAIDLLMVAGGGSGGITMGGGGGAGEMKVLAGNEVAAKNYAITVGAGGESPDVSVYGYEMWGNNGADTIFGDYVAKGGGGGGSWAWNQTYGALYVGRAGGSGGGTTRGNQTAAASLAGSDGNPGYGNSGAVGYWGNGDYPGGGGGAGSAGKVGHDQDTSNSRAGDGGEGLQNDFATGEMQWYAAGGGGGFGNGCPAPGIGGSGIGGNGGDNENNNDFKGYPGVDGTGSGGGGSTWNGANHPAGNGGGGVVVVRVPVDTTDSAADIRLISAEVLDNHSARLSWDLLNAGIGERANVRMEYGIVQGLYNLSADLGENFPLEAASVEVGNLSEGTTYYARLVATGNGEGAVDGYSSSFSFTTTATTSPIGISVSEIERTGDTVSAKLSFAEAVRGDALAVAFGADPDDIANWTGSETFDAIAGDEASRTVEFDVGADDRYFRFASGENYSYIMSLSDAIEIAASAPVVSPEFTLDGSKGDKISVAGSLTSAGSADTASVQLELSSVEAMTGAFRIDLGEFEAGDIEATAFVEDTTASNYIQPDHAYYCRLVVTGEDGSVVMTPVKSVQTLGGCAVAKALAVSTLNTEITATATIAAFGTGDDATVELYVGKDANSLVKVGEKTVTAAGAITFVYTNSVFGSVCVQAKVINACETATFASATDVTTVTLSDTTTWTIMAQDGVVNWNDTSAWLNSWGTPGVNVGDLPGSNAQIAIDTDDVEKPVTIKITGEISVASISFAKQGMTATITGTENDYTHEEAIIHVLYVYAQPYQNITLKNIQLLFTDYPYYSSLPNPAGITWVLDGAYVYTTRELFFGAPDVTFKLINGAYYFERYDHPRICAVNVHFIVDDSTFLVYDTPIEIGGEGDGFRMDFYGSSPKYRPSTSGFVNGCGTANTPKIVFHIPEGGYGDNDPILYNLGNVFGMPWWGPLGCPFKIVVADDSPLFKGSKAKVTTRLVYSAGGYYTDNVILESESKDLTLRYSEDGKSIYADYAKKGLAIFVK